MSTRPFPKLCTMPRLLLMITLAASLAVVRSSAEEPYDIEWIRQFGTHRHDAAFDVVADGLGNVFVAGHTRGSLAGTNPDGNSSDAFLAKFDGNGDFLWTRQSGASGVDGAFGVSPGGLGSVFITGQTGGTSVSDGRHFLARYTIDGELLWNTQDLGPIHTPSLSNDVSADELGNIYVAGTTEPDEFFSAYVAKYDESGTHLWTREFGIGNGDGDGVFADGLGNVYVTGSTGFDPYTSFLSKYDVAGDLLWTQDLELLGTSGSHEGRDVMADGIGSIYVTGSMDVSPLADGSNCDAFLTKYDTAGNHLWTQQLGTDADETGSEITVDAQGNVYITGDTTGSLGGETAGDRDVFVGKFNPAGDLLWTVQLGTRARESDGRTSISADRSGNIYVAGLTQGILGDMNFGLSDAFLVKLSPPRSPFLAGDYNNNGLVEQADLDLVLSHWGTELIDPTAAGWLNDVPVGFVDQQELDNVLTHWGSTAGALASATPFPEPQTFAVALVLIVLTGSRRGWAAARAATPFRTATYNYSGKSSRFRGQEY